MPKDARKRDDWRTDPAGITAALFRAARRAHEIARATGTKVVVHVDGKTVEMEPNPEMFDDLDPEILGKLPPQAESDAKGRSSSLAACCPPKTTQSGRQTPMTTP